MSQNVSVAENIPCKNQFSNLPTALDACLLPLNSCSLGNSEAIQEGQRCPSSLLSTWLFQGVVPVCSMGEAAATARLRLNSSLLFAVVQRVVAGLSQPVTFGTKHGEGHKCRVFSCCLNLLWSSKRLSMLQPTLLNAI